MPVNPKSNKKLAQADAKTTHTTQTETSTITVETKKGARKPTIHVITDTDDIVREKMSGFFGFLRERAVVGLAVGFVVATQVQGVAKALISGFIDPLFTLLFGGDELSKRHFTLHFHHHHADFGWGSVVYALLDFLFVVAAIYAIIKLFKLDKLDKPKA
jgi:large-conductance mechanosensitive channel